jgi:hypothetical protein
MGGSRSALSRDTPSASMDDAAAHPVADPSAGRIEAAFGEGGDRAAVQCRHPAQLEADRLALGGGLDSSDERCLASRAAAALAAWAGAAASASSCSMRPLRRWVASRSRTTCWSLCLIVQAVVWVIPRRDRVRCGRCPACSGSDHGGCGPEVMLVLNCVEMRHFV